MEFDPGHDIPVENDFEGPSFDLGVGKTQSQITADDAFFVKKEVQEQVNEVIACVLQSTKVNKEEVRWGVIFKIFICNFHLIILMLTCDSFYILHSGSYLYIGFFWLANQEGT